MKTLIWNLIELHGTLDADLLLNKDMIEDIFAGISVEALDSILSNIHNGLVDDVITFKVDDKISATLLLVGWETLTPDEREDAAFEIMTAINKQDIMGEIKL